MSVFRNKSEILLLEPCDGKLSRTVLRGESVRKGADLPAQRLDTYIGLGNKEVGRPTANAVDKHIQPKHHPANSRLIAIGQLPLPMDCGQQRNPDTIVQSRRGNLHSIITQKTLY